MTDQKPVLEAPDDPANEQPLVAHLIELRNRLMKSVIAIVVVFACLSPFMKQIFDYLSQPLMVALPQAARESTIASARRRTSAFFMVISSFI